MVANYYAVENFAAGMDLRKSDITAPAGTMRLLRNAHVTSGGEIEKRQAFRRFNTINWNATPLPGDTFGLIATKGLTYTLTIYPPYVKPATASTVGVLLCPVTVYHPIRLLDWDLFDQRFYVIIQGSDGVIEHFYQTAISGPFVKTTGVGTSCRTYKSRMYCINGKELKFSALNNPTDWTGTTAGYINLSLQDSDMEALVGLEIYYDYLAIMSEEATQLWFMDEDKNKNQFKQLLRQAGTIAPKSVRQYGSGDVLFLSADGIRSLKAKETSLAAAVSDIGSPVDPYILDMFANGSPAFMAKAIATIQPFTGRYWMVFPDRILVLSNYPSPKISAWSIYEPPSTVVDVCEAGGSVYLRCVDNFVYIYGGANPIYDGTEVEVYLPMLGLGKPATFKTLKALDAAATGTWMVYLGLNPNNYGAEDYLGTISGATFLDGQFAVMGHSTHFSLRFRSANIAGQSPEAHTLSTLMLHYDSAETT